MTHPEIDYVEEFGHLDSYGIGIVGAGAIVRDAHLPAYMKVGFDVRGVYDLNPETAANVAQEFRVDTYDSLDALLEDDDVDVVDIAVPPSEQFKIVKRAIEAEKHLLCQKPLAVEMAEAREIIELVDQSEINCAVNQQYRWDKCIRTAKQLLDADALGKLIEAQFRFRLLSDWSGYPWIQTSPRNDVLYFGIHYLDALRYLLGDPNQVYASVSRGPEREENGETASMIILEYPDDLRAILHANHDAWHDQVAEFRLDGTDGAITGDVALFLDREDAKTTALSFASRTEEGSFQKAYSHSRFPDAFIGAMGSLLASIEEARTPMTAPADNYRTLQLVNTVYKSTNKDQAIDPSTVETNYFPEL